MQQTIKFPMYSICDLLIKKVCLLNLPGDSKLPSVSMAYHVYPRPAIPTGPVTIHVGVFILTTFGFSSLWKQNSFRLFTTEVSCEYYL